MHKTKPYCAASGPRRWPRRRSRAAAGADEEISSPDWKEKIYKPDIANQPDKLWKKPGYIM
jgi:hypothetical protein